MHRSANGGIFRQKCIVLLLVDSRHVAMLDFVWKPFEWLRRPSLHIIQSASRGGNVRLHVVLIDPEVVETSIDLVAMSVQIPYWQWQYHLHYL